MNKSFERQRMSLKSGNRSLVGSEQKRAAKTISCMRNGKVALASNSGPSSKPQLASTTSSSNDDEKKMELASVALKQEPEDEDSSYYEENGSPPAQPSRQQPSSSRAYQLLTRVRSHSRSLRAMANPSAVWAHFDLCSNDPLRAQCRICGAVVVRGGANPRQCGTTNLHRHLRVHHGGRLVGRRYQVAGSFGAKTETQTTPTTKALRLATQNLVRQMRQIAPAATNQRQQKPQQQQQQQQRKEESEQPQQPAQSSTQQQHKPMKTLVLKTIPLKVAPGTIKMPMRPSQTQNVGQTPPQIVLPQPPTEVCLRWNSYHSNMQNSFPSLLDSEQFVDVTLACEGRSLKCHKMILSSCSDYLAQLLRENPCQHPIILMKDLKFWEVEALVKFMYRGEVNVTHDKLPQLLNAAEALQVKGLAGPSNSQAPKPPLLIPQTKSPVPPPTVNHASNETKDRPSTSSSGIKTSTPNLASPKRGQKRRIPHSEVPPARPFTKIRLQRPSTFVNRRLKTSPPMVKVEPMDPLSPPDDNHGDESSSNPSNIEGLIGLHPDNDPGGNDVDLADPGSDIENDDSRHNYSEDQMGFVPTDFLEQDIGDDVEDQTNCSQQYTDDDSKHNNEEDDYEDDDDDDDGGKSEE